MSASMVKAGEAAVEEVRSIGRQPPAVYVQTVLLLAGLVLVVATGGNWIMQDRADSRREILMKAMNDEIRESRRHDAEERAAITRDMMSKFSQMEERAERRDERVRVTLDGVQASLTKLAVAVEGLSRRTSGNLGPFAPVHVREGESANPAVNDLDPVPHAGGPGDAVMPGSDAQADQDDRPGAVGRPADAPENHGRRPDRRDRRVPQDVAVLDDERRRGKAHLDELAFLRGGPAAPEGRHQRRA